jgi:hypothetical protein
MTYSRETPCIYIYIYNVQLFELTEKKYSRERDGRVVSTVGSIIRVEEEVAVAYRSTESPRVAGTKKAFRHKVPYYGKG